MGGEKRGKKMSPDEVHLLLRRDLPPNEYVKPQQIRSLFSRWSKLLREGNQENEPSDDDSENYEDEAEKYNLDLHELANEVSTEWKESDWVAVVYGEKWYAGVIIEV